MEVPGELHALHFELKSSWVSPGSFPIVYRPLKPTTTPRPVLNTAHAFQCKVAASCSAASRAFCNVSPVLVTVAASKAGIWPSRWSTLAAFRKRSVLRVVCGVAKTPPPSSRSLGIAPGERVLDFQQYTLESMSVCVDRLVGMHSFRRTAQS